MLFRGEFWFLSNFHPSPVTLDEGPRYPTVEHAYQAAKTLESAGRLLILCCRTPHLAKKEGRRLVLRPDWEDVKLGVMENLLRQKFSPNSDLAARLLATGDLPLVEDNDWGDVFWGVSGGVGQNHLGRLLVQIRGELRQEQEAAEFLRVGVSAVVVRRELTGDGFEAHVVDQPGLFSRGNTRDAAVGSLIRRLALEAGGENEKALQLDPA